MLLEGLRDAFRNPSAQYRSYPFYSLNDRLYAEELQRQVHEMHRQGMGGVFLHSREGLETEYMGEEWFSSIETVIQAAKDAGMYVWLYDEDRFPSGGAGGQVQRTNREAFGAKAMTLELGNSMPRKDETAYYFAVCTEGNKVISCRKISGAEMKLEKDEVPAIFRIELSKPCEWFNGEAPADNMNPHAVACFIEKTHEKYRKRFGGEFGKTVKGIFTDEPNIADFRASYTDGRDWIPWTDGFGDFFEERCGYKIEDYLPYIYFEGSRSKETRHDYWHMVAERFCEAYSRQIGIWCEENELIFTGHYMAESVLGSAVRMSGAVMPHYMYQKMPGIDILSEQTYEYLTVKQLSSVANQLGRRSICELYGCTGWEFSFESQKWVGDWLFAMGVDTRCQHHAMYSIKGCRKRDYPPSFNYNNCWWEHNGITEDYFARISAVMSGGKAVRKVLLLHPLTGVWAVTGAGSCRDYAWNSDDSAACVLQQKLEQVMHMLLGLHIDFDFGDEMIMEKIATVSDGELRIAQMQYPVIVLPYIETVMDGTFKLLLEFMEDGGTILSLGAGPTRINARETDMVQALHKHKRFEQVDSLSVLEGRLNEILTPRLHILNSALQEQNEMLYLLKEFEDHYALFISNNDRNSGHKVRIVLPYSGRVERWNPLNGKMEEIGVWEHDGGISFIEEFEAVGSGLYVICKDRSPLVLLGKPSFLQETGSPSERIVLKSRSKVTRSHPNVLLLDVCRWRMDENNWSEPVQVWQAQQDIRKLLGMRQIYCNGSSQRYNWIGIPHPNDGRRVEFCFSFNVSEVPEKAVHLAVETPQIFDVSLNGQQVLTAPDGWYIDRNIETVPLPALKKGKNILLLGCSYKNRTEVEDCYILGDFAVDMGRNILGEIGEIGIGDWGVQGYFHYAGTLIYHYAFEWSNRKSARLVLGDFKAVTVHINVNDKSAGDIPWRCADGLDITQYLKPGQNSIDIEVVGSQRNVLGLFHQTGMQNIWVDWTFFSRNGAREDAEYITVPYGLFKRPYIELEQT